jgi:hypothetical protein
MGAAFLITLGVLFLLEEFRYARFEQTWPVLLLVLGIFSLIARTASTEDHVQPFGLGRRAAAPPQQWSGSQDPWASGRGPMNSGTAAPPSPSSGQQTPPPNDQQVKP